MRICFRFGLVIELGLAFRVKGRIRINIGLPTVRIRNKGRD